MYKALEKTQGISDVFSAHRQTDEKEKVNEASIAMVLSLAGCTDQLQRLDQKMNKPYKDILKKHFNNVYYDRVKQAVKKGVTPKIDLQLSAI